MKTNQRSFITVNVVVLTIVAGFMGAAHAADKEWDGGADPDRNWTTGANWFGGNAPASDDEVEFKATGIGVVEVDTPVTVGSIRFLNPGYTLQGNQITINPSGRWTPLYDLYSAGTGSNQIDSALKVNGALGILTAANNKLILNGVISDGTTDGSISFESDSHGKALSLRGANTYTGGTTVSNMTLELGDNSALGTGTWTMGSGAAPTRVHATKDVALNNAVSLEGGMLFGRHAPTPAATLTLNGTIAIDAAGVVIEEFNLTRANRLELAGTITDNGHGFTLKANRNGGIAVNSANNITGDVTFVAAGSGHIWTKDGEAGLLALGNENALGSGTLRIMGDTVSNFKNGIILSEGGHLTIDNDIAVVSSDANIGIGSWGTNTLTLAGEFDSSQGSFNNLQINRGSTLAGTGTIAVNALNSLVIKVEATLSPGNTGNAGGLTINGNLNMENNSIYDYDGGDLVTINGEAVFGNWTLNLNGTELVEDANSSLLLFTYATGSISDPSLITFNNFDTAPTGLTFTDDGSALYLNGLAVIPEPSSVVLMLLGGVATVFLTRRRRLTKA